jgi:hypothetical protein
VFLVSYNFPPSGEANISPGTPHPLNLHAAKTSVVYYADGGSKEEKRWCAVAALGADGRYTAFAPEHVGNPSSLIERLRNEFLTAARCVAAPGKQAISEVVEWASGDTFKYGDVGRMTKADTPKLRSVTELMASALAGAAR